MTGGRRVIQRLAAWTAHRSTEPGSGDARDQLAELEAVGFDRLLDEHRRAWALRWADAEVSIDGPPGDQLATRFAVFHLLAAAHDGGEAAVGARGLTGPAYGGHVFWDADVFVLPALAAIWPAAARAMLEYRIRRLPAARTAATEQAQRGARFPWESADTGRDVTPRQVEGPHGERIAILTGEHEEHIDADVAWAASTYSAWSGDGGFLAGAGRDLVVETARYWAGRARLDPHGRAHLCADMGPDEYHQVVDDNAYTNVMPAGTSAGPPSLSTILAAIAPRRLPGAPWPTLWSTAMTRSKASTSSSPATSASSRCSSPTSPHRRWRLTSCWAPRGWPARRSSSRPTS